MAKINTTCIIDDDPIFVYSTKRIMKEVDFSDEIMVFNNGQDAIDGLSDMVENNLKLPPVIFLDLNMPIMNGWEFLDDFVQIPNPNREQVVIYIISSSIDPRDLERIKNYPAVNNYILKPVVREDLHTVLEQISGVQSS
ncbi:MAG: response regulator [Pseudozobellia sp.]|nr:response regulator [Pseudozobellia sp.]MBG46776.1 response regulator [Pseudozobellia sp.]|tara:strand:+ start:1982 stop:2398 length:417 start_codon:yes stop_codon:yes gene_type:complete